MVLICLVECGKALPRVGGMLFSVILILCRNVCSCYKERVREVGYAPPVFDVATGE